MGLGFKIRDPRSVNATRGRHLCGHAGEPVLLLRVRFPWQLRGVTLVWRLRDKRKYDVGERGRGDLAGWEEGPCVAGVGCRVTRVAPRRPRRNVDMPISPLLRIGGGGEGGGIEANRVRPGG